MWPGSRPCRAREGVAWAHFGEQTGVQGMEAEHACDPEIPLLKRYSAPAHVPGNVRNSVRNCPKVETIQLAINVRIDEVTAYPLLMTTDAMDYYVATKMECSNMCASHKHSIKREARDL